MKRLLHCRLQNRLGALDRALGALTQRGLMPDAMATHLDPRGGDLCLSLTLTCPEDKAFDILIKALQKQVYMLSVSSPPAEAATPLSENITPLYAPTTRRIAHALPHA